VHGGRDGRKIRPVVVTEANLAESGSLLLGYVLLGEVVQLPDGRIDALLNLVLGLCIRPDLFT
jgi:hypothetical protein